MQILGEAAASEMSMRRKRGGPYIQDGVCQRCGAKGNRLVIDWSTTMKEAPAHVVASTGSRTSVIATNADCVPCPPSPPTTPNPWRNCPPWRDDLSLGVSGGRGGDSSSTTA